MDPLEMMGCEVTDEITGCKGVVMAVHYYLTNCVHASVQPNTLKDGKPVEWETFDCRRLKVSRKRKMKYEPESISKPAPGGPVPSPPRN